MSKDEGSLIGVAKRIPFRLESFLGEAVDASPSNICILDAGGRIIGLNEAWRNFAHTNQLSAPNVSEGADYLTMCNAVCGPDSHEASKFADGIRSIIAGERDEFSLTYPCNSPDGQRWFLGRVTRLAYNGSVQIIVSNENITNRKRSEELLRIIICTIESSLSAIGLADLEGKIVYVNNTFVKLWKYDGNKEIIGKHITEFAKSKQVPSDVLQALKNGKSYIGEDIALCRDGSSIDIQLSVSMVTDDSGKPVCMMASFIDISLEKQIRRERETTLKLMGLLNARNNTHELIRNVTGFLHEWSGCEAVGVRLQNKDDFPYFETCGFPHEFVIAENSLCERDRDGQIIRDECGNPVLDCMCGNILRGRFDPALPFFTKRGSFWSNCTTDLLASTTDADRQARTRNRCNGEGYESVALIALRHGTHILGLLQFNDKAKNRFTPELITFLENTADQIAVALAQRQAQEALQEREEIYSTIVNQALDGIVLVDPHTLRFIEFNDAACRNLGYTREQFSSMSLLDVQAVRTAQDLESCTKNVLEIGEAKFENKHRCKNGEIRIRNVSNRLVRIRDRDYMSIIWTDITERKLADEALRESEKRFATIFNVSPISVVVSGISDGIFLDVNESFLKTTGFTREEIIGHSAFEVNTWADFAQRDELVSILREKGSVTGFEAKLKRKSGKIRDVLMSVENIELDGRQCMLTVAHDITDRKQIEESLRKANDRLELAQGAAGIGVWDWDVISGHIEWSPQMFSLFGLDAKTTDASFETWESILLPEDKEKASAKIRHALENHIPLVNEYRIVLSDGKIRWINSFGKGVNDDLGRPIQMVGICQDVTDRKLAEQILAESESRYRSLFNTISEGFALHEIICNSEGVPCDYRFLDINPAFENITGLKREVTIGKTLREILPGEDPAWINIYGEVALTGSSVRFDNHSMALDKSYEVFAYSPAPRQFATLFVDITDFLKTQEALLKSNELFTKAFDSSPAIMCILSLKSKSFIEVNKAFEKTTGYNRKDTIGRTTEEIGLWDDIDQSDQAIETIANDGSIRNIEAVFRIKSGELRNVMFSAESILFADEKCVLGIAVDVTERKRVEEALKVSDRLKSELLEKLNEAQHIAMIGSWEWNLRTNHVWWSDETYRIFGLSPQEFTPNFEENGKYIHPDDLEKYRSSFKHCLETGEPLDMDIRLVAENGRIKYCTSKGKIVYDKLGGPFLFVGTTMDITDRKRAEIALEHDKIFTDAILESVHAGIIACDADGNITLFNNTLREYHGISETSDPLEASFGSHDLFQPDGKTRIIKEDLPLNRALQGERVFNREIIIKPDNGIERTMLVNGGPLIDHAGNKIGAVVALHDITQRKRAAETIIKSEMRYRTLFDNMLEGYAFCMMVYDNDLPCDLIYLTVNNSFERLTGLTNVLGKRITEILPNIRNTNPELFDIYHRVSSTGEPERFETYLPQLKVWLSISVYSSERGYFTAVFDNITERKLAEEELQQMQAQLAHVARLSTMGEMAAGIAHEVNQPLCTIVNYAKACRNILAQSPPSLDLLREWCEEISNSAARTGEIIRRMCGFARKSESQRLITPVLEILDESIALVAFDTRYHRVTVHKQFPNADIEASVDRIQIQQVLVNLLRNACEAMTQKDNGARILKVGAVTTDNFVEISVADNGCGLPDAGARGVFEPFFTTKQDGLGLGLPISKTIIEAHGGRIWADSNPENGTTFHFTLPLATNKRSLCHVG